MQTERLCVTFEIIVMEREGKTMVVIHLTLLWTANVICAF